jgi:putative SOS response-associated peptidase YedK
MLYIRMRDGEVFAFAGLWERWQGEEGKLIESCAIIVTEASEELCSIHDRMPVILDPADYERWLNPNTQEPRLLDPLLRLYPAERMTAYAISPRVNSPKNDDPSLIVAV